MTNDLSVTAVTTVIVAAALSTGVVLDGAEVEAKGDGARSVAAHRRSVLTVDFSPDGEALLSGGAGSVKVWDVKNLDGRTQHAVEADVRSAKFFPDGERILVGRGDGVVEIWDTNDGNVERAIFSEGFRVIRTAVSPDGRLVAAVGSIPSGVGRGRRSGAGILWDVQKRAAVATLRGHDAPLLAVAFCEGGKCLVTGDQGGTVYMWRTDTGERIGELAGREEYIAVTGLACGEKRAILAIGAYPIEGDGSEVVELWDIEKRQLVRHLPGHSWGAWSLALSANGETLAAGFRDGTVKVWTGPDWTERLEAKAHDRAVNAVAVSPDGGVVATGGQYGVIKMWHVRE